MKITLAFVLLLAAVAALGQRFTAPAKWDKESIAEVRKMVERAVTLKHGDSYQTVTNALGKPDLDRAIGGRWSSNRIERAQRVLHYSLSRPKDTDWQNEDSRFVQVLIDFKTERVDYLRINAWLW